MTPRARASADDALLRRAHRTIASAKGSVASFDERRRILVAASDLSALVSALAARSRELDEELQSAARRANAITAYRRGLKLRGSKPGASYKGAEP